MGESENRQSNRAVFLSMIGISWLWFFGSIFLTSFTGFAKEVLSGNEQVVTLLLATFSVGIGVGSVLCEKMSGHRVEIGLVPFGAIGMTVFAIDLYFASPRPDARFAARRGGVPADRWELARLGRFVFAGNVRRFLQRASIRVDAISDREAISRAHYRGQQYSECALHGGGFADGGRAAAGGTDAAAAISWLWAS